MNLLKISISLPIVLIVSRCLKAILRRYNLQAIKKTAFYFR